MSRVLACSCVLLDAAWPALGPGGGAVRREASQHLLVEILGSARDNGADAVAVLGGLCDAQTVTPTSLATAASVFGAFDGPVWVVPGGRDAWATDSPYRYVDWPDNVRVLGPGARADWPETGLKVAAGHPDGRPDSTAGVDLVLIGGGDKLDVDGSRSWSPTETVLVGARQSASEERMVAVGQLLPSLDVSAGGARLVTLLDGGVQSVDDVDPRGRAIPIEPVDVTHVPTSDHLAQAVAAAAERVGAGGIIRLAGTLPVGIVLPGSLEPDEGGPVPVDLSQLSFSGASEGDGVPATTTKAQFEAAVAQADAEPRTRHQATALGLHGLIGDLG